MLDLPKDRPVKIWVANEVRFGSAHAEPALLGVTGAAHGAGPAATSRIGICDGEVEAVAGLAEFQFLPSGNLALRQRVSPAARCQ
jgi:hypothetical protein